MNLTRSTAILFAMLLVSANSPAQLFDDPSSYAFPDVNAPDPDRALAISLTFNAQTGVRIDNLIVSNRRAHTALGGPPELVLELLDDRGGAFSSQYVRDPLQQRDWDENGLEATTDAEEVSDIFFVAISEPLAGVRIRDAETGEVLAEVDASDVISEYCDGATASPICPMFKDSFEPAD